MRALTICQPYAELILRGDKRVENRTWETKYRGPLAIHAGKSRQWFDGDDDLIGMLGEMPPFGAIVGRCNVIDCVHIDDIEAGQYDAAYPWLSAHEHTRGPWCWIVDDVERLEAVPFKGSQGLFNIPSEFIRAASRR